MLELRVHRIFRMCICHAQYVYKQELIRSFLAKAAVVSAGRSSIEQAGVSYPVPGCLAKWLLRKHGVIGYRTGRYLRQHVEPTFIIIEDLFCTKPSRKTGGEYKKIAGHEGVTERTLKACGKDYSL